MGRLHRLEPKVYWYTFGPHAPALSVQSGDTIVAETRDARGLDKEGEPLPDGMAESRDDTELRRSNPLVGPVFVDGARRGDVLAVKIEKIRLTRSSAWSKILPNFGSLTGEGPGRRWLLNTPLEEKHFDWELDPARGVAALDLQKSRRRRVEIPLSPFIGSIGIAPRFGRVETALTPGEYGGNMDCVAVKEGVTLLFPVWVDGAYLSFGDVHAAQGEGEVCGVALETSAEVTLRLEVLKEKGIGWEWPRMENEREIMTSGSTRPLYEAVAIAHREMVDWLEAEYGYDRWEGFQVLSQVGRILIGNVVDPNYTAMVVFPKAYL